MEICPSPHLTTGTNTQNSLNFTQISAVTWVKKPKKKLYGFSKIEDLSLVSLEIPQSVEFLMIISLRKRYLFSWNHFILLYIHFSLDLSQITPLSRTCHISYIGFCTEFFYRFIKFYRILYLFFARQSYFLRIFHIFYII